ncbi:MAG: CarD family transcriptional regulator [Oscillospiraceae bacterium]|nr:CarD family transcriptional regulator [Oscillospiraceae bacterium]
MFSVGELIAYGNTGVCRVETLEEDRAGMRYVLKPLYQNCVISLPVESTKVFMRPLISKDEALALIDSIPSVSAEPYHNKVMRQLIDHYEDALRDYDCAGLIELTLSIYAKKKQVEAERRKFGSIDERYMKRAESLLFGELAAALDVPREKVKSYIADRLGGPSPFGE